ncbi:aldo/keto reductase [Allostreptomyces psammosilenae]|uniref:Diketogulonate reductase-like aldo/keto reductase n=1 Tax=Allostreptomyces psammosilenae TaxID=1892865 RepID=A0A852ZXX9_9ACTN|nr:aldo/keto reductase [Allostreptomyces psammosilenae]NYI03491.1 diketogulonate reductase-like aldo/keto reductase [Allostreptomyces psammosilenae]
MTDVPAVKLNDGAEIPQFGFGVWQVPDDEVEAAVATALEAGYRSIDTAAAYGNERGVGRAIAASGLPREELYITTKLWNSDQGYDSTLRAFDESISKLGLDYVDLYLTHWPTPARDKYVDTFRAFLKLQEEGRIRSVGVSNHQKSHLRRLIDETGVTPAVNQIELHPRFPQEDLRAFHAEQGIVTEAWSPLGQGRGLLQAPELAPIAERHGKTPAQVVLRWHVQLGNVVIPKSVTPSRIRENIDIYDFELSPEDVAAIDALATGERLGPDPDTLND